MAIPWQDNFDIYNSASDLTLNYLTSPGSIQTTGGPNGEGCWTSAASGLGLSKSITSATELWLSGRIQIANTGAGDRNVCSFMSASSVSGGVEGILSYNQGTGVWTIWRGYQQTVLGTFTKSIASGWHWIDVHYKYSDTVGVFEVWIDETQMVNFSGDTAQNSSFTIIAFALCDGFGVTNCPLSWSSVFYSDASTGRLGDSRIETLVPTSDTSPNQATPSTGTDHFACVDEAQFSFTDYLTMANTSGHKEVFGHGSISSTPAVVHDVKVILISEKDDAGSFLLEPLVISSGTEGDGSSQQLTLASPGVQQSTFLTDPHTSAAWAYAAANAASIGYKVP